MITAGPAYCAAAVPVVTKMPAPTTDAIPSAVRLTVPIAALSSRSRSRPACATTASKFEWVKTGIVPESAARA